MKRVLFGYFLKGLSVPLNYGLEPHPNPTPIFKFFQDAKKNKNFKIFCRLFSEGTFEISISR
jgi:hypothetical protein